MAIKYKSRKSRCLLVQRTFRFILVRGREIFDSRFVVLAFAFFSRQNEFGTALVLTILGKLLLKGPTNHNARGLMLNTPMRFLPQNFTWVDCGQVSVSRSEIVGMSRLLVCSALFKDLEKRTRTNSSRRLKKSSKESISLYTFCLGFSQRYSYDFTREIRVRALGCKKCAKKGPFLFFILSHFVFLSFPFYQSDLENFFFDSTVVRG